MEQDGMQSPQQRVSGRHWYSSTANHCINCHWGLATTWISSVSMCFNENTLWRKVNGSHS
eukprot:2748157-Prorocentrum_lima.AAC.1